MASEISEKWSTTDQLKVNYHRSSYVSRVDPRLMPIMPTIDRDFLTAWNELTRRQRQVISYRCAGRSVIETANELKLAEHTVKNHSSIAVNYLRKIMPPRTGMLKLCYQLGRMDALVRVGNVRGKA